MWKFFCITFNWINSANTRDDDCFFYSMSNSQKSEFMQSQVDVTQLKSSVIQFCDKWESYGILMSDIYAHHRHATGDVKFLAKGCKKKRNKFTSRFPMFADLMTHESWGFLIYYYCAPYGRADTIISSIFFCIYIFHSLNCVINFHIILTVCIILSDEFFINALCAVINMTTGSWHFICKGLWDGQKMYLKWKIVKKNLQI